MTFHDSKPDRSLVRIVRDALAWADDEEMIVAPSGNLSGSQMRSRCDALRDELLKQGATPQTCIAYAGSVDVGVLVSQLGIVLAGGIPVPLASHYPIDIWIQFIIDFNVKFIICEPDNALPLRNALEKASVPLQIIEIRPDGTLLNPTCLDTKEDHAGSALDLAEIIFSSGSTGFPKAFALTLEAEYYFISTWLTVYGERQHGRFLCLSMSGNMHTCLSALLRHEVLVIYAGSMNAREIARAINQHRITDLFIPPSILMDFINNREVDTVDISTLQRVAYGGQAVSATEKNRIAEKIGCEVLQFYGGTESGLLTFLGPEEHRSGDADLLSSAGKAFAELGTSIQIWDFNSDKPLESGQIGRIMAFGHGITRRLFGSNEDFQMRGDWRDTDDVGYLNEDGYLFIKGRASDAIRTNARVIFSGDVESLIAANFNVAEVAVHGMSNSLDNDHIFVWVKPSAKILDKANLAHRVSAEFAIDEQYLHIELLEEIPHHQRLAYKVDKALLRSKAVEFLKNTENEADQL